MITSLAMLGLLLAGEPATMFRAVVREVSEDIPAGDFRRQPKTLFRVGSRYVRVEEERNAADGVHLLMIINEPDVWMINLVDRHADHIVDPGPTFNAHAVIFQAVKELEFGRESEYMKKHAAVRRGPFACSAGNCYQYTAEEDGTVLTLLAAMPDERPPEVAMRRSNGERAKLAYDAYETSLSVDLRLFEPPTDLVIRERR